MMIGPLVTKADLDAAGCDAPGCTHDHSVVFLHAACHMTEAVHVRYDKTLGQLIIGCFRCGREVARIEPKAAR
jgi:hypothetical protein